MTASPPILPLLLLLALLAAGRAQRVPSSAGLWAPARAIPTGGGVIPAPTQDVRSLRCGRRELIVGGDGAASARQLQAARDVITEMCVRSPWFRYILSLNRVRPWGSAVQLTLGARKNTYSASWGSSLGWGLIDIATNTLDPSGPRLYQHDTFVAIVAHEVNHIAPELPHGEMMDDFVTNVLLDMNATHPFVDGSYPGSSIKERLKAGVA